MAAKSLKKIIQHQAYRLVFWQLIGVVIMACLTVLVLGLPTGLGILSGGMAYGLPNVLFVFCVFRYTGAQQMTQFVAAFFVGEMIKLFTSALLVVIAVKLLPVSMLSVLMGLIVAIIAFWIVCIVHFSSQ